MQLSESTIEWIRVATKIAADLGVDGLIFDDDGIHGYNDDDAIVIACFKNLDFDFDSLGIAGIPEFRRKLKIVEDRGLIDVAANEKNDKISSLTIKGKKIKYEFRCADPKRIQDIPKRSLKINPIFSFTLTSEDIKTFKDAAAALRNKNVVVRGKDGEIQFTFSDETGDTMSYTLDTALETHMDDEEFTMVLSVQKMYKIFRKADEAQEDSVSVNILKNMIVHLNINDIDVLIMSEV